MAINLASACSKPTDRWGIIRSAYNEYLPSIMESEAKGRGYDPYILDWYGSFSPIEQKVWGDIRYYGGRFYPQFPALKYFLDFANPFKKIGIEADGAQWHDYNKDLKRDESLLAHGWRIFRIKGSEANSRKECPSFDGDEEEYFKRQEMAEWYLTTSEGVIAAIQEVYFVNRYHKYRDLCILSLQHHRLIDFSIE